MSQVVVLQLVAACLCCPGLDHARLFNQVEYFSGQGEVTSAARRAGRAAACYEILNEPCLMDFLTAIGFAVAIHFALKVWFGLFPWKPIPLVSSLL